MSRSIGADGHAPDPQVQARAGFDYGLDYRRLNFRRQPRRYRVGRGEQGVLLVEPYKSELLRHWRFRTPKAASASAKVLLRKFGEYRRDNDFVGMDMARKFLQMGYTRARRYANHASGRKYDARGAALPPCRDPAKAKAAAYFKAAWARVESDPTYAEQKRL